jgi:aryl-alcohol dehydrogenase-like predicted oxidoreductase
MTKGAFAMQNSTTSSKLTHSGFSRRRLIAGALAGVGAVVAGPGWLAAAANRPIRRSDATAIVTLGRTGIKTSRLAQGTGYNGTGRSSEHTRLGMKAFTKLIRHGMDQGICFMDMADLYGSHQYVRAALEGVPRDKYTLMSKIWPRQAYWNSPSGGAKEEVNRFRRELNTDVIDICLMHCMTNGNWPKDNERVCDELAELRQQGVVRAVGVSCHNLDALKVAATHPWTDVVLARINNVGRSAAMDASVEDVVPVLKQAKANGKVVLGMKIFGAGKLVTPAAKDASLKFVIQNNLVDAMTVGMLSPEQVDDTIQRMNQVLKA